MTPDRATAVGLLVGYTADLVVADPRRAHPVALFGRLSSRLERAVYADVRWRGLVFTTAAVGAVTLLGAAVRRGTAHRPRLALAAAAATTWTVLGGSSLARTADQLATALDRDDLDAARSLLPALCGRDPDGLDATELARATVESVAENTSDAVVAPLLWGAVAGVPGLLAYRAVNTLDAMVGHRSPRYRRFGQAAARLDDGANLLPARLTALLVVALAPVVAGHPRPAMATWRRDGARHPSPNAGHPEAAFAGALGVRLGGVNRYGGRVERRGPLGDGAPPGPADIPRATRLSRAVALVTALLAAGTASARERMTR